MIQIGNDGNLLPAPVTLTELDEQGIAERYDIVIDFSRYAIGDKVWMVNLCEHQDGKKPARTSRWRGAVGQVATIRASASSSSSASCASRRSPT
jgi:FtsP/CotA-like multicopper oxidase with cupredoxin domain